MLCSFQRFVRVVLLLFATQFFLWIKDWIEMRDVRRRDEEIKKERIENPDEYPLPDPPSFHNVNCNEKQHNILFLKTHKTASSTVTSILNRFADINNLSIALPVSGNMFRWPNTFRKESVDFSRLKKKYANILCNHAVYHRNEFFKVMKRPFKIVTILRDPVSQFYSGFFYGNFTKTFQLEKFPDPVQKFIENPRKYYGYFRRIGSLHFLLHNSQTFDLNYPRFEKRRENNTFDDFLQYLDKSIEFVMIAEYFDEAAIMLKDLLCWNYMDIVYTKKMIGNDAKYKTIVPNSNTTRMIRSLNYLDVKLYEFFKEKFLSIKSSYNQEKFAENLLKYQTLNKLVSEFCQTTHLTDKSVEKKREIIKYLDELREEPPSIFLQHPECFCNKLLRNEVEYLRYFEQKYPQYYYANVKFNPNAFNNC